MALLGFRNCLQILLSVLFLLPRTSPAESSSSPYLSPAIVLRDFPRMIENFKIFAYSRGDSNSSGFRSSSPADLFHLNLLRSRFLTADPEQADLFYVSLAGLEGQRSVARCIRRLRSDFPFWNRTLGADHFFVSEEGIGDSSDRNLVELRKNSIQLSPFPAASGRFIPHKDITLPSFTSNPSAASSISSSFRYLAFYDGRPTDPSVLALLDELRALPAVMIESEHQEPSIRDQIMSASRFCLFFYGFAGNPPLGDALKAGCVPIIVSGGPILDLPFSDVLQWSEIALLVPLRGGIGDVRRAMAQIGDEKHTRMKEMGIQASALFRWDVAPSERTQEPRNAFHAAMFQLWRRRHAVRYARWAAS